MWNAFWHLHNGRTGSGGGANPLDIESIISYAQRVLRYSDIEEFIDFIQAMDFVMLKHLHRGASS